MIPQSRNDELNGCLTRNKTYYVYREELDVHHERLNWVECGLMINKCIKHGIMEI